VYGLRPAATADLEIKARFRTHIRRYITRCHSLTTTIDVTGNGSRAKGFLRNEDPAARLGLHCYFTYVVPFTVPDQSTVMSLQLEAKR